MADTALDICSRALVSLGANPITSFTANTTEAKVAKTLYESVARGMLSLARWSFSRRTIQLSRLATPPGDGVWNAAYALPADWLGTQSLTVGGQEIPFEQFEGTIRCDAGPADEVMMKFVARVPEDHWPASFVSAIEAELMARFAFPVTAQESVAAAARKLANDTKATARGVQSQGEPTKTLVKGRFRSARQG